MINYIELHQKIDQLGLDPAETNLVRATMHSLATTSRNFKIEKERVLGLLEIIKENMDWIAE